jgi:plasmid stabilization system protein ParE
VRRIVVHRYPYIVYYIADAARREVVIVTIQHGSRRQPFEAG